jgi:hypothetical protein
MRHLGSLVLSVVLGPVIWLLTGLGLAEYAQGRTDFGELRGETAVGVLLLLLAGALYTVLVSARLSPVGPAIVGVAFLGLALWNTVDRSSFFEALPRDLLGQGFAAGFPAEGFAFVLAGPLLATVVSPRRWRRLDRPAAVVGYGQQPGYAAPPGFPGAAPAYPQPGAAPGVPQSGHPAAGGFAQPGQPAQVPGGFAAAPPGQQPAYQTQPAPPAPGWMPPPAQPHQPPPVRQQPAVPEPAASEATAVLAPRPPAGPPPPVVAGPPVPTDATAVLPTPSGTPAPSPSGARPASPEDSDDPTRALHADQPPEDPDATRRM